MKYCINYDIKKFKYLNQVDEITIHYRESDTSLLDFMQIHADQQINIFIEDAQTFLDHKNLDLFAAIKQYKAPDLSFKLKIKNCREESEKVLFEEAQKENIPIFFNEIITDWDVLQGYLSLGPSDVYIGENLGFEIKSVAQQAHQRGVKVRAFPNVAQSRWKNTVGRKKFFIRPEDVKYYKPFIDTLELFGDPKQIATYYKIYAIDKEWFGNLNEIIIDLNEDIDSRCLLPNFSNRRLNCGKKCMKGSPCDICTAEIELAHTLHDNNLNIHTLESNPAQKSLV